MLIKAIKINRRMYNTYKKRILFRIKKRFQRFRSRIYKKKVAPLRFKTRIFRRRVDLINFNAKKEKLTFKVKLYKIVSVRKTRNKNFVEKDLLYKQLTLIVCLLLFSILAALSLIVLVRISLLLTGLSYFIRTYASGNRNIGAKYILPIVTFITRNRLFCRFLLFCDKFTNKFFNIKSEKILDRIIFGSKCVLVLGVFLRSLIIIDIPLPYPQIILWILALNGVFRAFINLGILLSSGDNLLKQLMEIINRNAGKHVPGVSTTIPQTTFDATKEENKNNNSQQNNNNNSQQKKETFNIGQTFAGVTAAAAFGSFTIAGFTYFNKETELKRIETSERHHKENLEFEQRKHEAKMQLEKEKLQTAKDRIATDNRIADGNEARLELEKKKFEAKMLREKSRIITENALSEKEKQKKRRGWFSK